MRRLLSILFAFLAVSASAQIYTATVVLTNLPAGLTTNIVINGTTRNWTNDVNGAPSTSIMATNTIAMSTTNLLNHLTSYPLGFAAFLSQSSPTNVIIRSQTALTITFGGGWADVTYVTNTTPRQVVFTLPITVHAATNQTNIATWSAEALEFSTTSLKMHWPIMAQVVGLTNNNVLTGTNQLRDSGLLRPLLTNVVWLSGVIGRTTNGYWTNAVLDSPITTNLVNRGNAISSPGAGTGSEQFGTGAQANGLNSFAAGNTAIADGINSYAGGKDAYNGGDSSVAVGTGVEIPAGVGATNVTVYGNSSSAGAPNSGAFGSFVTVSQYHTNSFGMGESTTETNQTMLWGSTQKIRIPGQLQVTGSMTNNFLTGSNRLGGSWSLTRRTDSSQPTGHNIITNSASDNLVWLTAPAGACTNVGFTDGIDGRVIEYVKYNGGYFMGIANESGLASAERRVLTGTGADVTITNSPGWFRLRYDSTLSRWILTGHSN